MEYGWRRIINLAVIVTLLSVVPLCLAAVKIPSPRQQPAGIGDEPYHRPEQRENVKQSAGEIAAVDLAFGRLTLREIGAGSNLEAHDYAISRRDTTVTDPLDKQFLKLEDLQPGYLVQVEYAAVDGRRIAQKITVDAANSLRWAVGQIFSVDVQQGILLLNTPAPSGPVQTMYVITPRDTQAINLQEHRFMNLEDLRPGETVQVQFALVDGKRVAYLVSSLEPSAPEAVWSSGRIESIDPISGIVVVSETIPRWNYSERVNYVLDLSRTPIVDFSGRRFITLADLRAGQPVELQFTISQGQRFVQCIILKP